MVVLGGGRFLTGEAPLYRSALLLFFFLAWPSCCDVIAPKRYFLTLRIPLESTHSPPVKLNKNDKNNSNE